MQASKDADISRLTASLASTESDVRVLGLEVQIKECEFDACKRELNMAKMDIEELKETVSLKDARLQALERSGVDALTSDLVAAQARIRQLESDCETKDIEIRRLEQRYEDDHLPENADTDATTAHLRGMLGRARLQVKNLTRDLDDVKYKLTCTTADMEHYKKALQLQQAESAKQVAPQPIAVQPPSQQVAKLEADARALRVEINRLQAELETVRADSFLEWDWIADLGVSGEDADHSGAAGGGG